ncbi:unnamed protein product [Acanthoscelides obtectus]|uniref:Uncharacterized protein n=1 Tax=Acanthoscelides obtectus TaxID=200917 RepID=A0A9P0L894_ACAOB|nr:unnamed protein product [Acanthoscelides obtectus]CAK1638308.1 hypothetical protein AOBTE_LOCUS10522 [Acanthoscelides obtectus]
MMLDVASLYIHVITAICITFLLRSQKTERCVGVIIEFEEKLLKNESPEVIEVYLRSSKFANTLCISLASTVVITGMCWFVIGRRESYALVPTDACPFINGAVFQLWYPFDTEKYPWIYSLHDTFFVVVSSVLITYDKTTPLTMILFVIARIRILQHKVTIICETHDSDTITKNIKDCLKDHQEIIRRKTLLKKLDLYSDYSWRFPICTYFFGLQMSCR